VLLEAMAAGVPVVATRVGGIPDIVTAEEVSLVPGEDPEALAREIRRARTDYGAFQSNASRARARLSADYGLESWLDRYDDLYREIVTRRRVPPYRDEPCP
jgi:glycosyltransferase involved in cell wall biosynthesis